MTRMVDESQQADWIMPPIVGGILCLAATTVEVDVDLTGAGGTGGMAGTPAKISIPIGNDNYNPNPVGHYLNLQADGADIYIAFSATLGALGTLSTSAVTTVTAHLLQATNTATGTIKIPNGATAQWKLPIGNSKDNADVGANSPARYLGFLTATGSGTLRMWQSSP